MNETPRTEISTESLKALAAANARNKRMIQAKRGRFAKNMANMHNLRHDGKFPTKYKYG